ncbi:hypothetical protein D3C80_1130820 [compost metagenome]
MSAIGVARDQGCRRAIDHRATVASRLHATGVHRAQSGQCGRVGRPWVAVLADLTQATRQCNAAWLAAFCLQCLRGDADDFLVEPALRLGLQGPLMAAQGPRVHRFTSEAIGTGQVFRSTDHVHAGSRVVQGFPEKVLEPDRRPQAKTAPVFIGRDRIARHRLRAHAQHLAGATAQLFTGLTQQFKARATDALHRQCRYRLRHATVEADMAWQHVGVEAGLGHAAGEHAVYRLRGGSCTCQHRAAGLNAQVDGRDRGQCATQVDPGRAHHLDDGRVLEDGAQPGRTQGRTLACNASGSSPRYSAST